MKSPEHLTAALIDAGISTDESREITHRYWTSQNMPLDEQQTRAYDAISKMAEEAKEAAERTKIRSDALRRVCDAFAITGATSQNFQQAKESTP